MRMPPSPLARRLFHRVLSRLVLSALLPALALAAGSAWPAETFPARPVRVIIPYAPGGGADAAARLMANALGKALGQSFIVESRAGGNTSIAALAVARAPADGYTLLMTGGTTMSLQPLVNDKLAYDPLVDFTPVGMLSHAPFMVVVSAELGANSLDEVLRRARAEPGSLAYASNGIGGPVHLSMELLAQRANVRLNHVPYKGFAPALPDLVSGRTPITMLDLASLGSLAKSGKLKIIATTSPQRSPQFPDVPTVAELGFPGYEIETWFGLYAPAKTPPSIVGQLNDALRRWLAQDEAREALKAIGQDALASTPEAVRQRIVSEQKAFAPLVKAANIRAE